MGNQENTGVVMSDDLIGGPCKTCGQQGFFNCCEEVSEPAKTTMTIEEADATIKSLTSMLIAARTERNRLREAISDAGFSVMQTSGRWSIHDVSKFAEAEQAKTDEIIGQNIDLEIKVKKLEATIKETCDVFKAADAERLDGVHKACDEAERWKADDDMYGWNFHQGKSSGMTEASIIFNRAFRRLMAGAT
jgi:hypothetical protein